MNKYTKLAHKSNYGNNRRSLRQSINNMHKKFEDNKHDKDWIDKLHKYEVEYYDLIKHNYDSYNINFKVVDIDTNTYISKVRKQSINDKLSHSIDSKNRATSNEDDLFCYDETDNDDGLFRFLGISKDDNLSWNELINS